jgi:ABC-type multidrug transport system fused ATPase/permease subunit
VAKSKRKIYLINPHFQIKFSLFFCGLIFLSSLIYPITIYDLSSNYIEYASKSSPFVSNQLEEMRNSILIFLSLWQLGFIFLVFILCIFFSHKLAGPMYKLQKFLREKLTTDNRDKLRFRKGDYFTEVADDINALFERLETDQTDDIVYLDEVKSYLGNLSMIVPEDKQVVLQEITSRIELIQERYRR